MKIKITIYLDEDNPNEINNLKSKTAEVFKDTMSACAAYEISEKQFNHAIKRITRRMDKEED